MHHVVPGTDKGIIVRNENILLSVLELLDRRDFRSVQLVDFTHFTGGQLDEGVDVVNELRLKSRHLFEGGEALTHDGQVDSGMERVTIWVEFDDAPWRALAFSAWPDDGCEILDLVVALLVGLVGRNNNVVPLRQFCERPNALPGVCIVDFLDLPVLETHVDGKVDEQLY